MIRHRDESQNSYVAGDDIDESDSGASPQSWGAEAKAPGYVGALEWFFANSAMGFCVLDLDLRFRLVNALLAEINGLPVEAHLGKTVAEIIPALLPLVRQVTAKILETRQPVTNHEFSGETVARPGVTRHWLESWHPLIGADAEIIGFAVTVEEITQRREAEEALRKLIERYELVLKGAGAAIWDWDVPKGRAYYSPRWKELHGFGDEPIGDSEQVWKSSIHPDDLSRVMDAIAAHFEGKTPIFQEEYRIRRRDGSERWVLDRGLAGRDDAGAVVRMAGSEHDITDRKTAEKALARSHEDFRRAQEVGQIGWWRLNVQSNVLQWSEENYRIFDVPSGASLTYDVFLSFVHPDDRDFVSDRWSAALTGEPYDIEHRVVLGDGSVKWLREKAYLEFDETGALLGGFGITQDITSRKRVEESLLEMDRRKNEFITMLAHELRNPLAPLRSGLYLFRNFEPSSAGHRRIQQIMERQVDHLVSLVDDLLDVSRLGRGTISLKKERLGLEDLVTQIVDSRRALASGECPIRVHFRESPIFVSADPVRMTQILNNLLDNANKYSPGKGNIDITVERRGAHAVVSVKDHGIGVPADMLPRIFDVFIQVDQNQSEARGGLGIGLALVRSLVELHGGTVEARSEGKDKGSEFVVRLPLSSV